MEKHIYFQQERHEVIILSLRKYWLTSLKLCKAVKLKLTGRGNCSPPPPTLGVCQRQNPWIFLGPLCSRQIKPILNPTKACLKFPHAGTTLSFHYILCNIFQIHWSVKGKLKAVSRII